MTIYTFYQYLFALYGPQHWWPCQSGSRWEIVCGAILTQNCAWINVGKALANLAQKNFACPQAILAAPDLELEEAIRPAGFFRQKRAYLQASAEFLLAHETEFLNSEDLPALRQRLLAVRGVGRETADSILLYAFQKPVFVIDAYTRRVAERHLRLPGGLAYDALQGVFQASLPRETQLYNEFHALIVCFCKESCRKAGCGHDCPER